MHEVELMVYSVMPEWHAELYVGNLPLMSHSGMKCTMKCCHFSLQSSVDLWDSCFCLCGLTCFLNVTWNKSCFVKGRLPPCFNNSSFYDAFPAGAEEIMQLFINNKARLSVCGRHIVQLLNDDFAFVQPCSMSPLRKHARPDSVK